MDRKAGTRRTRASSLMNKPASKIAASVGDTLKLLSGVCAPVTKLLKRNGVTTHIYVKQPGMSSQDCISVNDEYEVIPVAKRAKSGTKKQLSPRSSRSIGIGPKDTDNCKVGEKGRKFFEQCGWLEGKVVGADVAKDDSMEVLYLVEFEDGSSQQLDEKELTEFKYELANKNDTPPNVRHFVTPSPSEHSTKESPEGEPESDVNNTIAGKTLDAVNSQSSADMQEKNDAVIVLNTSKEAGRLSSETHLAKAPISTEDKAEVGDKSIVALANVHDILADAIQPTNSLIRCQDDMKDISNASPNNPRDMKCRVASTGTQQKVPFHWPIGSRSILVDKGSFDFQNQKFQIAISRCKPIKIDLYQGILYSKNRRRVNSETPCYLSGQVHRVFGSASPFVIAFGVEFEKLSGPVPPEVQGPMMYLGFTLNNGGNFDRLYLLNSLALVKNSLIDDDALKEILSAPKEIIVAAVQKGIQAAVSWVRNPFFNSLMWRKVSSSSAPFPGVPMVPDDSTTGAENPKTNTKIKFKRKKPSEDKPEKRTKMLATARAQNKELRQENQELRLQADLMRSQNTKEIGVSNLNTGGDITVKTQDLLKAEHAQELAEKKLEWALKQQVTILEHEKMRSAEKTELFERMLTMKDDFIENESRNTEKQVRIIRSMSNQNTANMLKVHSLGSTEGGNIIGSALQNNFFYNNSPDRRSHQGLNDDDHHLIGNDHEPPRRLLLGGSQEADAPVDKKRIRDNMTVRIQGLIETLSSLDGELKGKVEAEISRLNGEVITLNKEIAIALCPV